MSCERRDWHAKNIFAISSTEQLTQSANACRRFGACMLTTTTNRNDNNFHTSFYLLNICIDVCMGVSVCDWANVRIYASKLHSRFIMFACAPRIDVEVWIDMTSKLTNRFVINLWHLVFAIYMLVFFFLKKKYIDIGVMRIWCEYLRIAETWVITVVLICVLVLYVYSILGVVFW